MSASRWRFFKAALTKNTWAAITLIYTAVGFLEQTRDYFVSQDVQQKLGIEQLHLPLYLWGIGLLVVVVFAVVDHSYTEINERDGTIAELRSRLTPKLAVKTFYLTATPTQGAGPCVYVQLLPTCLTDSPVENCEGHLLQIHKWTGTRWQSIFDETLSLGWSIYGGYSPIKLQPGVDRRLNIFWFLRTDNGFRLCVEPLPLRLTGAFNKTSLFRFEVKLTAKDCAPVDVCLDAQWGEEWDKPLVGIARDANAPPTLEPSPLPSPRS